MRLALGLERHVHHKRPEGLLFNEARSRWGCASMQAHC